ncbi:MAG: nickel pincer cofactor biosynthesis protein LarC [Phormidesmis sp. RL_2_1]|nr:nickel pincer cofactor biosynthesis protein LarC [Phormidesmis sp. RL_2_1]
MKTLAYLDCPTGIAGDMCLGALVHAGVPLAYLETQLARLGIANEFCLRAESVLRNGQAATQVHVDVLVDGINQKYHGHSHEHTHHHEDHHHEDHHHEDHHHGDTHHSHPPSSADVVKGVARGLLAIEALISQANLPERASTWSLSIFRQLAKAEAAVHGILPEQVHFHEVGAVDAIVDIVGTCLGLDWLQVDAVVCSPLPTGSGTVRCDHGLLPVPVPAVLSMMASNQMPVYSNGIARELVTPTGCAIAATLAESFGSPPSFTPRLIGLGAGNQDLAIPNILRLWIGSTDDLRVGVPRSPLQNAASASVASASVASASVASSLSSASVAGSAFVAGAVPAADAVSVQGSVEDIVELQTQLDDISPQAIGYVFDLLFTAGAVDVFTQAVAMKKNRLGTLLTVLCPDSAVAACEALIFQETTTLGIRRTDQKRSVLGREMVGVTTAYGEIAIKVARSLVGGAVLNLQPEFEDCAKVARSHNIPWQQVHQAALHEATVRIS